jgi:hypothetical protein
MVTDPKTTVRPRWGQAVVVFFVAFVDMLLRLAEVVYAPFYALFMVGPAAMVIENWLENSRQSTVDSRQSVVSQQSMAQ